MPQSSPLYHRHLFRLFLKEKLSVASVAAVLLMLAGILAAVQPWHTIRTQDGYRSSSSVRNVDDVSHDNGVLVAVYLFCRQDFVLASVLLFCSTALASNITIILRFIL